MADLKTSYEFTLPRGYVDRGGQLHRTGRMRLATARDELEPLRDPLVTGPDDPRLTILVLGRVVEQLGDLESVGNSVIEGLFAVDLAFLQDFYGVINFGSQEEYDALLQAQSEQSLVGETRPAPSAAPAEVPQQAPEPAQSDAPPAEPADATGRPPLRAAVEELPRRAL
jgi:hypothetical protein